MCLKRHLIVPDHIRLNYHHRHTLKSYCFQYVHVCWIIWELFYQQRLVEEYCVDAMGKCHAYHLRGMKLFTPNSSDNLVTALKSRRGGMITSQIKLSIWLLILISLSEKEALVAGYVNTTKCNNDTIFLTGLIWVLQCMVGWATWRIDDVKSLPHSDAMRRQRTGSTLVQLMPCCLLLTYHQWGPVTFIWMQCHKRYLSHSSLKLAWKLFFIANFM